MGGFTELDEREANYHDNHEEQQCANDSDEYGADAHVKYLPVVFLVAPLQENKSENYGLERNFVLGH